MDELKRIQSELDAEGALWEQIGINLDNVSHTNSSLFIVKNQLQGMLNVLIDKGLATEEEINIQFKTCMLEGMQALREAFAPAIEQARIAAITGKAPLAVPDLRIVGPDGKEMKV